MTLKGLVLAVIVVIPLFCLASSVEWHSFSATQKAEWFDKNKWIAAFLALIGGTFGLHRWYMGHYKAGMFHILCFLFSIAALQFVARGAVVFPIIFILLMLGYIGLEIIANLKRVKQYLKPFQDMLLALAFIPLSISLVWIALIFAFSGPSVYLVLATSIFALFSLFLAFRYATSNKRTFIERFHKNRSIWH